MRKRVTIRGLEDDAWDLLIQLRADERRHTGAIIEDCIREYYDARYEEDE